MLRKLRVLILFFTTSVSFCQISEEVKIHSHNDYAQEIPFKNAFDHHVASIEIDVFLKNGVLYVTHDESEIQLKRTIETIYLEPIKIELARNNKSIKQLQLLIDVKSESKATITQFIKTLADYPSLIQSTKISFVISGHRPSIQEYVDFPEYILFDYQSLEDLKDAHLWDKVALISLPFHKFSKWTSESEISEKEYKTIKAIIDKAHRYGKPFRFWATPDTKLAWKTFEKMGVDYINTDYPAECVLFFKE